MTDRPLPEEPPPDVDAWTAEPDDPDMAGPGAEFADESADGTPGVRSGEEQHPQEFDQESNN
ncbi:MAG TPA: hypothetical protein VJS45_11045 [Acidimicrobiia bacterium]|nr:hypothetical protein [Acidimicrobiia bacterium]